MEEEGAERELKNADRKERNISWRTRGEGEGIDGSGEERELRIFGDIELKKRKPPDGEDMCRRHKGN